MQTAKRKRHLTALVVAFIALIAIGGAFALQDGILDLDGTINIGGAELLLVWSDTGADSTTHLGAWTVGNNSPGHVVIGNRPADTERTAQRVTFGFTFQEAGTVALEATARNAGTVDAVLSAPRIIWEAADTYTNILGRPAATAEADWANYIDIEVWTAEFLGLIPVGQTRLMRLVVDWDGDMPAGVVMEDPTGDPYVIGQITVEFDYTPAP
jgi:hypothetical protein